MKKIFMCVVLVMIVLLSSCTTLNEYTSIINTDDGELLKILNHGTSSAGNHATYIMDRDDILYETGKISFSKIINIKTFGWSFNL